MTYAYGKDNVKKHCYDVYLRNYPSTADISGGTSKFYAPRMADILNTAHSKEQNLYHLAATCLDKNGMKAISTSVIAPTVNYWYKISTSGSDISILLASTFPAVKAAGDILVFEHYSKDASYTLEVTDSNAKAVALHNEGDVGVFIYTTKWEFWFYAAEGSTASPEASSSLLYYYTKIGILDASPNIKTAEESSQETNECTSIITGENIEVNATVLEVTKANWEYLRTWKDNNVDIIFYDKNNVTDGIETENLVMTANLEATGNDINKIPIVCKGSSSNVTNLFGFTHVGT